MNQATILQQIIAQKHREIELNSARVSLAKLEASFPEEDSTRGFIDALREKMTRRLPTVIAEVKKASPSKGLIREHFDPVSIARSYAENGASCLSVLTDVNYFQGSNDYLIQARGACNLPVLRKDFMVSEYQIAESRVLGADCILLIVAALEPQQLTQLAAYAKSINIDVLVEVHNRAELDQALGLELELIGINNRNLHNFETSLDTTVELAESVPADRLLITESGIHSFEDVQFMLDKGVFGFLIGETFMRADDPGEKLREMGFG
ncbi:MAG: indole-3-glycerol-phosphate synthase [SAR86 cluster bacterium]|uniref:Indole-3-glycerol phosphate synthase n=1 Tax=SAR86 cluster bacterium TaxID=2030880 RepID=A0A2A4MPW9_9GAMM|nr:MAG: indole-3-glycerol-phosphate synthase [SAR86 cluster bacterium]